MVHPDRRMPAEEHPVTDEQREVGFAEFTDDLVILPDTTADDTDAGWGERSATNDRRLLDERPPHWD